MWSEVSAQNSGRIWAARLCCVAAALMIALATVGVGRAQDAAGPPAQETHFGRGGRGPVPPEAIEFLGFQAGLSDKVVTGAPFTATMTTTSTQTLADGNVIKHESSGSLARDSQGRTRRDMMLPAFGPLAESGQTVAHVTSIMDPVANTRYLLETDKKVATMIPASAGQWANARRHGENSARSEAEENETVTTSLGTQTIGGVSAEGTRYTRTIPAGQIGNVKPIVIVTERWYSPELQTVVMTKRSDPRMGDTAFQLSNIVRQEPAASLFQIPADYTVKQGGLRGERAGGPPPPAQ